MAKILRQEIERGDQLRKRLEAMKKPRYAFDLQPGMIPCGFDDRSTLIPSGASPEEQSVASASK